jgi:hypothetical protein
VNWRRLLQSLVALAIAASVLVPTTTASGRAASATVASVSAPAASAYVSLVSKRLLDTRNEPRPLQADSTTTRRVLGQAGIPAGGVAAVVLTVTLVSATGPGFVTVWPAGASMPMASNLNADQRGDTVANLVTVMVPATGDISLFTSSGGHLLVDVTGYYASVTGAQRAGRFHAVAPERIRDTRNDGGPTPAPAVDVGVLARAGVPVAGVAAVAVNITITNSRRGGFATTYPTGSPLPNVSAA